MQQEVAINLAFIESSTALSVRILKENLSWSNLNEILSVKWKVVRNSTPT